MSKDEEEEIILSLEAAKLLHEVLRNNDKYRVDLDLHLVSGLNSLALYSKGEKPDFNLSLSSDELGSDTMTFDKYMVTSLTPEGMLTLENDSGEFVMIRIWQAFSLSEIPEFEVFNVCR